MKKLFTLLSIALLISCSSDDSKDCDCKGQFGNVNTGEIIYQQTDCDKTPPSEEWVFIKCADKPDY